MHVDYNRWAWLVITASAGCSPGASDRSSTIGVDSASPVPVAVAESLTIRSTVAPVPAPIDSIPFRPTPDSTIPPAIGTTTDSLSLSIPVEGIAASELRDTFGDPRTGHAHEALDIMAPRGTPVLSAADGRLTKLFLSKQGGIMVYASDASDRYVLMYGHLDRYADGLTEGMTLRRGQLIGYVGSTGDAAVAGPHLHFAIARGKPSVAWWKGEAVNPYPLLAGAKP
jgi:murein DD-endopeptidase MepM/ murein hydrolase activator NlpD